MITASMDQEYFKLTTEIGELIGYVDEGLIVLPKCVMLNEVTITDQPKDKCFNGLKVKIKVPVKRRAKRDVTEITTTAKPTTAKSITSKLTTTASTTTKKPTSTITKPEEIEDLEYKEEEVYLLNQNILVKETKQIECEKQDIAYFFPRQNSIIQLRNGKTKEVKTEHKVGLMEFIINVKKYAFSHYKYIKEEIDLTQEIINNIDFNMQHEKLFYSNATFNKLFTESGGGIMNTITDKINNYINNTMITMKKIVKIILICIGIIILTLIAAKICFLIWKKYHALQLSNIRSIYNPYINRTQIITASAPQKE
jgi:hypothetical protein